MRTIRAYANPTTRVLHKLIVLTLAISAIVVGIMAMHTLNFIADSPAASTMTETHHPETPPPGSESSSCDKDCGPIDHEMMSMTICVLALLSGVLFVAAGIASWRQEQRWGPVLARIFYTLRAAVPAPPSLYVLSISRT